MQTATHHIGETKEGVTGPAFVSLDRETDPAVINPARLAALERKAPAFVSLDAETGAAG